MIYSVNLENPLKNRLASPYGFGAGLKPPKSKFYEIYIVRTVVRFSEYLTVNFFTLIFKLILLQDAVHPPPHGAFPFIGVFPFPKAVPTSNSSC